jgi:hypothetical protein
MRWDNLFDDLEGQLEQELYAEDIDFRAEEERLRLGRLSFRERLFSLSSVPSQKIHTRIIIVLCSRKTLTIGLRTLGKDWIAGDLLSVSGQYTQCIVPLGAIAALNLTYDQVQMSLNVNGDAHPTSRLVDRIGLVFVLRDLCRRRCSIEFELSGCLLYGTIDRVGRDHFDLAIHEPGTTRSESNIREYRIIPLREVMVLRL